MSQMNEHNTQEEAESVTGLLLPGADAKTVNRSGNTQEDAESGKISRRTALKALAGVPVAGLLGVKIAEKYNYETTQKLNIVRELGLNDLNVPVSDYGTRDSSGELIRLGIIGYGARGTQLSTALGFLHPDAIEQRKKNNTLKDIVGQEYLNVAITGVCDVFDLHAANGILIAQHPVHPEKVKHSLPVKRYLNYHEMLADKEIDAVIISTPDHHHARMAVDALRAGKHVYLEKSVALLEDELNELYRELKSSKTTFQLGHQINQSAVFQQAKEIIRRNVLGKITLVETNSNRNSAAGAWIRHLDANGIPKPGDPATIDWKQWLGNAPDVPFSLDRFYNWTKWFDYDSGLIGQLFTHEFDAVNQLLHIGIPSTVTSSGGTYYWKDNREMADVLHCIFEYPEKDLTLTYSGNLASGHNRGRLFMGHDATMELGNDVKITIDRESTHYRKGIEAGIIDTSLPAISFNSNAGKIDALSSATEKYFAARGLTNTSVNGRNVDVTHLHLREWLTCIREQTKPGTDIDMVFEEGIACIMAHRSYVEKRTMSWDKQNRRIV